MDLLVSELSELTHLNWLSGAEVAPGTDVDDVINLKDECM